MRFVVVATLIYLLFPAASRASLVVHQWSLGAGGNGHYYAQVVLADTLTWPEAKSAAEALSFMGHQGHLVTITSAEEQTFVSGIYDGEKSWIGLTDDPAFGGTESFFQPNPQVDGWIWVTGEPVTFTHWFDPAEPNNQGGAENFVTMGDGRLVGGWNDDVGRLPRYLVEFDIDAQVPEPASLFVWSALAAVVWAVRSRSRVRRP